jgi:low temperature requirement protein LtrA
VAEKLSEGFQNDASLNRVTAPFLYLVKVINMLQIWQMVDGYLNRFGHAESLVDTLFILLQFIVITCASATVEFHSSSDEHQRRRGISGFALSIAFSNFILMMCYGRVAYYIPEARAFCVTWTGFNVMNVLMWLIVAFIPARTDVIRILFGVATIIEHSSFFYFPYFQSTILSFFQFDETHKYIPINVRLSIERSGLLIIIAIGEVIVTIVGHSEEMKASLFGRAVVGILLGFLFKFMYFDVFHTLGESHHIIKHACQISRYRGILNMKGTLYLAAAIVLTHNFLNTEHAGGSEHSVSDHTMKIETLYDQGVFGVTVSVMLLLSYFMGLGHRYKKGFFSIQLIPRVARSGFMIAAAAAIIAIGVTVEFHDRYVYVGIVVAILAVCVCIEFICTWYVLKHRYGPQPQANKPTELENGVSITAHSKHVIGGILEHVSSDNLSKSSFADYLIILIRIIAFVV